MSSSPSSGKICGVNTTDTSLAVGECELRPLDRVGLAFVAEAGFLSLAALLLLFLLIIRNVWRYHKYAKGTKWSLVKSPADVFVLSLFVADILQAIGAALDTRWVHRGIVEDGGYCNAQGAIQQLGETTVALAVLAIALHTFLAVWMKVSMKIWVAYTIVFVYWLFVVLFIAISASTLTDYFDPTPFWCWVGGPYSAERKAGEYVWLWIGLIVSVLVYVPLFLENLGFLAVDKDCWWKVKFRTRGDSIDEDRVRKKPAKSSLAIIAYPVAYSIIVLPVSIVRWDTFTGGRTVPDAATFFSVFLHDMFGAVNVMLLLTTRTNRLLFEDPRRTAAAGPPVERRAPEPGNGPYLEMQEPQGGRVLEDDESDESHLGAGAR